MGSFHQPANYLKGGMKVNTSEHKHKTKLSKSKIEELKKKIYDFDFDSDKDEQYKIVEEILDSLDINDFESDYHKKELGILKHAIKKIKKDKVGSKPSEFLNIIEKILDNVYSGGGYQPANYLKGGSRSKSKKRYNGGFYPSVMGGVMNAGKILMVASLRQGVRMFANNRSKKKTRKVRKNRAT